MSTTVDSKIVQLKFDNKDFESNARTSMSTLEKLKTSLNFKGLSNGISEVASSKGLGLIGEAAGTVKERFSAMEVVAITALANITNSAINTGKQMLNSLTVQPISDGFKEYELKMGSVQTIMASTGADLDTVNKYLEDLNVYADKTIYSFADMTSSIGKFTNAGVSLEDAVAAIQGISNEAAVSGANAEQASHAMYNFAQALSAGYVKLIDWKSIENANMATVEFKTELLETAVACGTVEKTADGMYKALTENMQGYTFEEELNATKNFNDSLQYQWMTTEVLTKTLAKYADETTDLGKKAFAAAQDVKTFSQLMDTLKEAVGSGWAQSFEIIFGDFNEAKKLWTAVSEVVGGFINNVSKARNEILKTWDEMGGRLKLLKSITVLFHSFQKIAKEVKKAFNQIFPPKTDRDLFNLILGFDKLTKYFTVNNMQLLEIRTIFKGLFATIHIGTSLISELFKGFARLFSVFAEHSGAILVIGEGLAGIPIEIDKILTKTNFFHKVIDGLVDILLVIPALIRSIFGVSYADIIYDISQSIVKLTDSIKNIFKVKIDLSGLKNLKKAIHELLSFDTHRAYDPEEYKKLGLNVVKGFKDGIIDTAGSVKDAVVEMAKNAYNAIKDWLEIHSPSKKFIALGENVSAGMAEGITNFGDKAKDAMLKVGEKIFEAGSFIWDKIKGIVEPFKPLFDAIVNGVTAIINFIGGVFKDITKDGVSLENIFRLINGGLLVKILSNISHITGNLASMSDMVEILYSVKDALESWQKTLKAKRLLLLAGAVVMIAGAMVVLSQVNPDNLGHAISAIAVIMVGLTVMFNKVGKFDMDAMGKVAIGMLAIGSSILLLAFAVKMIASIEDPEAFDRSILAILALISTMLVGIMTVSKYVPQAATGLSSLIALAFAINLLVVPILILGLIPDTVLSQGLLYVLAIGGALVLFMKVIPKETKLIGLGLALIGVATAINLLIIPIIILGSLPILKVLQGFGFVTLLLMAIGAMASTIPSESKMLAFGAGLVLASVGITLIAKAISGLANYDWKNIAAASAAIFSIVLELSIAVSLLGKNPAQSLTGAAAIVAVALGVGVLAQAMVALSQLDPMALANSILGMAAAIGAFALIAMALEGLIVPMASLAGVLALLGAAILMFGSGVEKTIDSLEKLTTMNLDGLSTKMHEVMEILKSCIPDAIDLITIFLDNLALHAGTIVDSLLIILYEIIDGLIEYGPQILTRILKPFADLFVAIYEFFKDWWDVHSPSKKLKDFGKNLIDGLVNGVKEAGKLLINKFKELFTNIVEAIKGFLGKFKTKGKEVITNIQNGVDKAKDKVKKAIVGALTLAIDAVKKKIKDFKDAGKNIVDGLKEGISNTGDKIKDAATGAASTVYNTVTGWLQIKSPSRKFIKIGRYISEGMAKGIRDYAYKVEESSKEVSKNTLDSVKGVIENIGEFLNDDVDLQPSITPVLDLSDVINGMNSLDSILNNQRSVGLASGLNVNNEINNGALENTTRSITDSLSKEFKSLRGDVADLAESITRMKIVMDRGTVVGELIGDIDVALGNRAILAGRSV